MSLELILNDCSTTERPTNEDLLREFTVSRTLGKANAPLKEMLWQICEYVAERDEFRCYPSIEDMKMFAYITLTQMWPFYDPHKPGTPFEYYKTWVNNAFRQCTTKERHDMYENLVEAFKQHGYDIKDWHHTA